MAVAQIIFRDLPDGRIEIGVCQRDLDPSVSSPSAALLRIALTALGPIVDLRTIGEGLAQGKSMVTDQLLPWEIGFKFERVDIEEIVLTSEKVAFS